MGRLSVAGRITTDSFYCRSYRYGSWCHSKRLLFPHKFILGPRLTPLQRRFRKRADGRPTQNWRNAKKLTPIRWPIPWPISDRWVAWPLSRAVFLRKRVIRNMIYNDQQSCRVRGNFRCDRVRMFTTCRTEKNLYSNRRKLSLDIFREKFLRTWIEFPFVIKILRKIWKTH